MARSAFRATHQVQPSSILRPKALGLEILPYVLTLADERALLFKGAKPADIRSCSPTKFELVINRQTIKRSASQCADAARRRRRGDRMSGPPVAPPPASWPDGPCASAAPRSGSDGEATSAVAMQPRLSVISRNERLWNVGAGNWTSQNSIRSLAMSTWPEKCFLTSSATRV